MKDEHSIETGTNSTLGDDFVISNGFIKTPEGVALYQSAAVRVLLDVLEFYLGMSQGQIDQENDFRIEVVHHDGR